MKKLFLTLISTSIISVSTYGNEELPAGTGTTSDLSVQAFSHPLAGTRGKLRRDFTVGNSFFQTVWVTSPATTDIRDGLGPIYNATSCTACHFKDGRGRGLPDTDGKVDISLLFRLRQKTENLDTVDNSLYGHQFNPASIMGVPAEGETHVKFETLKGSFEDGEEYELKKPIYNFIALQYGKLENTIFSPRVGPQMIGLGLIENIKEEDILKNADENDLDNDGISGRPNYVVSLINQKKILGRFGWKAGQGSLLEQNASAFLGDIGITSTIKPDEDCTIVQVECLREKTKNDISDDLLNKVTSYTQLLAVPVRRNINDPRVISGKKIFNQINCISCHKPHFKTGASSDYDVLNNQDIYPYSDFLLHDMGEELADENSNYKIEGIATAREFRTPPLWGIGLIPVVNGHSRLLHDGRARNVKEAILWHGGEASEVKNKFKKLSKKDREDLIIFVNSL